MCHQMTSDLGNRRSTGKRQREESGKKRKGRPSRELYTEQRQHRLVRQPPCRSWGGRLWIPRKVSHKEKNGTENDDLTVTTV